MRQKFVTDRQRGTNRQMDRQTQRVKQLIYNIIKVSQNSMRRIYAYELFIAIFIVRLKFYIQKGQIPRIIESEISGNKNLHIML